MRFFYTIGIWFYTLGIRVAALFGHRNARLMVDGWKQWPAAVAKLTHDRPVVWFHAASLGEFEQARPVLEAYRRRHPDHQVLVTFFSPSGYEVRKNYAQADAVCYLPMDTPRNVRRFVLEADPDTVFFVKYEFWYNYLNALRQWGAKTYLFSAIFRPDQYFFKWYGGWFRKQLKASFAHLFVQNEESLQLLKNHGIDRCSLAGDTRFDRVHQIAVEADGDEVVEAFLEGHEGQVLVCGSTWPPDEQLLAKLRPPTSDFKLRPPTSDFRIILAPHVINEEHLRQIEQLFPGSIRYSQIENGKLKIENSADAPNTQTLSAKPTAHHKQSNNQTIKQSSNQTIPKVLIIDNIGLLSKLYRYATVAYIGGGFGVGIHNTLEAVAFGKAVLFGPNYRKFQEARDLIACGGGWSVTDSDMLAARLHPLVVDPVRLAAASQACVDYMQKNLGGTEIILNTIEN